MAPQASDAAGASPGMVPLVAGQPRLATGILLISVICWVLLVGVAADMSQPFAPLTMPAASNWPAASVFAVWAMWALMMAAMMLPSALPMILTFVQLCARSGERACLSQCRTRFLAWKSGTTLTKLWPTWPARLTELVKVSGHV